MPMRILHIISHFEMGGAERVALNIVKSSNPDFEYSIVEVIRGRGVFADKFIEELANSGIKYHRSHISNSKLAIVLFPIFLIPLLFKIKPAIVHTHTEVPDLAWYWCNLLFGRFMRKIKSVRTIHNTELWNSWGMVGRAVEKFFSKKEANIAISQATQGCYRAVYAECPPIIYNGIEEMPQQTFKGIIAGKINILFAGRMEEQKGVSVLVDVISRLKEDGRFVFHIVGNGSQEWLVKNALSDSTCVYFYDKIYGLSSLLSSFDYLFMPSRFEGLALMSIEASMAKLPAVINDCPGLGETLPGDWPLKVENNDTESFIRIFTHYIPTCNRESLAELAYSYAKTNFSLEKMQKAYEDLYSYK